MIKLYGVSKIYPPQQAALLDVDLSVPKGSFVFVSGASGAGKTTLFKLLFGAEYATSGQVIVTGRNISSVSPAAIAELRREIGVVFQDYKLLPRLTVIENVAFGLEIFGIKVKDRLALAAEMLEVVGLADKMNRMPMTLSGGEQQRVSLARALVHRPKLLLADEPTGNLDPNMARGVFDLLLEANAAGVTVLVATHNTSIIEELGLRTVVLEKGRIIKDYAKVQSVY